MSHVAFGRIVLACSLSFVLQAQAKLSLPGCEAPPALRQELAQKLNPWKLEAMPYAARQSYQESVLEDLARQYPRESEPALRMIQNTRWDTPERLAGLEQRYRAAAGQHPDDPLVQTLLAASLISRDTPAALEILERLKDTPGFPAPALLLADTYERGKRMDKAKAAANLDRYLQQCPGSTNRTFQYLLGKVGTKEQQAGVATALRERLERETDPEVLLSYEALWGLEFRVRPPQEHDVVRKRVALDVKRLEQANAHPDARWMSLLARGIKESGAPQAEITAAEDRLSRQFPHSPQASRIASERWRKEHKEPDDQKDTAAWSAYYAAFRKALNLWRQTFTEDPYLESSKFYAAAGDPALTEPDAIQQIDAYLRHAEVYEEPGTFYDNPAEILLDHHWQPERALDLMTKAMEHDQVQQMRQKLDDNQAEKELFAQSNLREHLEIMGEFLRAAVAAGRPAAIKPYRAEMETQPPLDVKGAEYRWWANRARIATLDGHPADAIVFYQKAIQTRPSPVEYWRGRFADPIAEDAKVLWASLGGSESSWKLLNAASPAGKEQLAQGRWDKAPAQMPAFELADLTGKVWRLKNLEGKTVLVNVWATWCGPCNAELPKLEQLYRETRNRPDVQVISFNIDEDLGLVAPFVRDKGYTFPVLPAYALVNSLINELAIPQNWLLDEKGAWRLSQLGFGGEEDWPGTMLQKMQSLRQN